MAAARPDSPQRQVTVRPWQRPQEKGIDLLIRLEAIEFVLTDVCDVIIIVSADRDLFEIPRALKNIAPHVARAFRIEAAVPCAGKQNPGRYSDFDGVHFITRNGFELVRDDTHYAVSPEKWKSPDAPKSLEDHVAALQAKEAAAKAPATGESLLQLQDRFGGRSSSRRPPCR